MATTRTTLLWSDGTNEKIAFDVTNDYVSISTEPCEGVDRSIVATFKTSDGKASAKLTVNQTGKREVFAAANGEFLLSDGGSFNVLKS
jgi:hypothetical protein